MSKLILSYSTGLGLLLSSVPAFAYTYIVAPDGSGTECTRTSPCALSTGAQSAHAGDTVILLDGIYKSGLNPENSGTAEAWITFKADDCALPIIEGDGEDAAQTPEGHIPSGMYTQTGTYLRFIGIVSRYWDSGFANGWTGEKTTNSNGNLEYINCIGDGNGRTGFAMYSAGNLKIRECIAAHNGGSPTHSWSSGIQLYAVQGTPDDNIIERSISFENVDGQKNNDGSGFIVDEDTMGATFLNNIAFRNGGSCMRLTRSNNTRMINFSCYHNGQNPNANSPPDPSEFYFTEQQSRDTAIIINSLVAASGSEMDPVAFKFPPETGLSNNVSVDSGPTPFFTDPAGMNPDFRPPAAAAAQVENLGASEGAPDLDIGFDPKCITKENPNVPYQQPWWEYAIDYDYIRSIGGVAQCFHPKQRTGGADIGAYELSGGAHEFSAPGSCVPDPNPEEGGGPVVGGSGGASSTGGSGGSGAEGPGGSGAGGSGLGAASSVGGSGAGGGTPGSGAVGGGAVGSGAVGSGALGGTPGTGGQVGRSSSCQYGPSSSGDGTGRLGWLAALALFGLLGRRRRLGTSTCGDC